MKCNHCNFKIEEEDNFCYNCGRITSNGYWIFKSNPEKLKLINGSTIKQHNNVGTLMTLMVLALVCFLIIMFVQKENIFKPVFYLKKQILNYKYGYNVSLMKTDNLYNNMLINNIEDAYSIIDEDITKQEWQCKNNLDVYFIEKQIEELYNIKSVSFCDMSLKEVSKIKNVIDKIYTMFPNIRGYLTNITITNAKTASEYIAYFEPINQFVNSSEDINSHNKVNKTQILLNSYYFLNNDKLNTNIIDAVGENWYVKNATWESTIAHEMGHYITFVALLKSNNIDNVLFVTKENYKSINNIIDQSNSGEFSKKIVNTAFENYKINNNINISLDDFVLKISNYACSKTELGEILYEETVAEAVHDYYLHQKNASESSLEIIKILKEKLY